VLELYQKSSQIRVCGGGVVVSKSSVKKNRS